jgi:hypothetical protein
MAKAKSPGAEARCLQQLWLKQSHPKQSHILSSNCDKLWWSLWLEQHLCWGWSLLWVFIGGWIGVYLRSQEVFKLLLFETQGLAMKLRLDLNLQSSYLSLPTECWHYRCAPHFKHSCAVATAKGNSKEREWMLDWQLPWFSGKLQGWSCGCCRAWVFSRCCSVSTVSAGPVETTAAVPSRPSSLPGLGQLPSSTPCAVWHTGAGEGSDSCQSSSQTACAWLLQIFKGKNSGVFATKNWHGTNSLFQGIFLIMLNSYQIPLGMVESSWSVSVRTIKRLLKK